MTLRTSAAASLLAILLGLAAACHEPPPPASRRSIVIATGGPGGAFYPIGTALAALYEQRIPGVTTSLLTGGSLQNVEAVASGRADLGFMQADVAYTAYRLGTDTDRRPLSVLRGIALLWMNTVHVAVPRSSTARTVADLRGARVAVGTPGSGTETLARIVLESYGLSYDSIRPIFLSFVKTVDMMRRGELDAALVVAGLPADVVRDLSLDPGIRLLSIPRSHVRSLRARYPFLQPLVVPHKTYPRNTTPVETLGVSSLLVSRNDLNEELAYRFARELLEGLPRLMEVHPVARLIDPEQAPATPIPLHNGAARYYRERQITQ